MAYVQVGGRHYPLAIGENGIGTSPATQVPLGEGAGVVATILVAESGEAVIRAATDAVVTVNGVQLGPEPTPLLHGDKIDIGAQELYFGDDRKGGNTRFVTAVRRPDEAVRSAELERRDGGRATGGRLISLVDGREYAVPEGGLTVGRDAACDVVVPTGDVSRRHAIIAPGPDGYTVTDTSTNGLSVNGIAVTSSGRLVRGDVLTIGTEDFRFYADAAPPVRPLLATLEVTSVGLMHGTTYEVRSPLTHIGRGPYNDVVLADESVSDLHAKLQRRQTGWVVVDMGSTNGTYVGGRRILGEAPLEGAPDLRVGGIKFIFKPSAAADVGPVAGTAEDAGLPAAAVGGGSAGHTRAIAALTPEQRARLLGVAAGTGAGDASPGEAAPVAGSEAENGSGSVRSGWWLVWVVLAAAVIVVILHFLL